jgi:transposase InsO family protein
MRKLQTEDPAIREILRWQEVGETKPTLVQVEREGKDFKTLWGQWELLEVHDGLLYRNLRSESTNRLQLVAPWVIRSEILEYLHDHRTAAHLGIAKTFAKVQLRYYWPGYKADIERWCQRCNKCAQGKPGSGPGRAKLKSMVAGIPLERVAMDFLGPLPMTDKGNQYILVLSDYFTKWTESYALPDMLAETVADCIVNEFVSRWGVPLQLHSDQGRDFESHVIQEICKLLQIEKTRTSSYHPQCDGQVERFNRTVQQMLKMFVNENRSDWDEHLPYVMMAYRSSRQDSTGCTPNWLMLGREVSLPIDIMYGRPPTMPDQPMCPVKYVEWVRNAMEDAFKLARDNLGKAAMRQKRAYDKRAKLRRFQLEDWVWYYYVPEAKKKLGLGWTGPWMITECISNVNCRIQMSPQSKSKVIHVDKLKLYMGDKNSLPSSWLAPKTRDVAVQTVPEVNSMGVETPQAVVHTPPDTTATEQCHSSDNSDSSDSDGGGDNSGSPTALDDRIEVGKIDISAHGSEIQVPTTSVQDKTRSDIVNSKSPVESQSQDGNEASAKWPGNVDSSFAKEIISRRSGRVIRRPRKLTL